MKPALLAVWALALATSPAVGGRETAALRPSAPGAEHILREFIADADGEAIAVVRAGCAACDWGETGREAAVLRIALDGIYSQHLVLARGAALAEYRIALGPVAQGRHTLTFDRDKALSAPRSGAVTVDLPRTGVTIVGAGSAEHVALSMTPIVYARPNTVGKFTDIPLLMWYEVEPTSRGQQYRYSVIFSNEDGGTQTDRLMATWGRTTDIEFVYGVEVDRSGRVLAEEFQGPGHEVPAFKGRHEGRHPLLWVSTDNNMVSESGPTDVRYAPMAVKFDLSSQSREAVMDANPWTYAIASVEMRREGKIVDDAPPGNNSISDPRRFVYVDGCATTGNAALALSIGSVRPATGRVRPVTGSVRSATGSVRLQPDQELAWTSSDRGLRQYRVARDGCFQIATPLPAGTKPTDIRALRVMAFERAPEQGAAPVATTPVVVRRINKVFMLDEHFLPGSSILTWQGSATIRAGGEPFEVKVP